MITLGTLHLVQQDTDKQEKVKVPIFQILFQQVVRKPYLSDCHSAAF